MAFEGTGWGKLSELVSDHLFGHIYRNKFLPVVHGDRVPDHIGHNRGTPRPRLNNLFFAARIQPFDLVAQVAIDKRPLFR